MSFISPEFPKICAQQNLSIVLKRWLKVERPIPVSRCVTLCGYSIKNAVFIQNVSGFENRSKAREDKKIFYFALAYTLFTDKEVFLIFSFRL